MSKKITKAQQKRLFRKRKKKLQKQLKKQRKAQNRAGKIFRRIVSPALEYYSVKELKKEYKKWSSRRKPEYTPETKTLAQKERDYLRFMNSAEMIGGGDSTLANNLISILKTSYVLGEVLRMLKKETGETWTEETLREYVMDGGGGFIADGEGFINIPGQTKNITITWDRWMYNNEGSGVFAEVQEGIKSYTKKPKEEE